MNEHYTNTSNPIDFPNKLQIAAQQALEALEFMADEWGFTQKANRPERWQAIDALRAALKQPEDEDYEDYDGQPDEAQEWHDFDPDC